MNKNNSSQTQYKNRNSDFVPYGQKNYVEIWFYRIAVAIAIIVAVTAIVVWFIL